MAGLNLYHILSLMCEGWGLSYVPELLTLKIKSGLSVCYSLEFDLLSDRAE
jgi:hypothetical protein